MDVPDDTHIVRLVVEAASNLGMKVQTFSTGGGCDANIFNKNGLVVANMPTGMKDIHTVNEWLDLNDLYSSARVVLEVVKLNSSKI